jgi:hypothetical protein
MVLCTWLVCFLLPLERRWRGRRYVNRALLLFGLSLPLLLLLITLLLLLEFALSLSFFFLLSSLEHPRRFLLSNSSEDVLD